MESKDKIALVIEGGGFKSVFSAGVLDAFLINRFNPFDIYIGVSSGAMSLSYFISGQYKTYFSLSKEVSVSTDFLSYRHAFSEQGYMDLKFLTKYAQENNPLELQKIKESTNNKKFYVVATNLDDGKAVYLEPNKQNIYKCLRATSSLPFFTKGKCKINGIDLMDGGWSDPIPVKSASDFGANKIVVIRPHPLNYEINELSYLGLIAGYWWKNNPKVRDIFFKEHIHYNESVNFLKRKHKNIEILQICPDDFLKSSVIGTSKEDLIQDYHCGLEKGMDFLNTNFQ
jgi:predicted patatin/cPLA2 family phospholipase|tara:strand:+ start:2122 stop:2976 length:855 start_codon:yes stop_codon:yes gene_type:complete